MNKQESKKEKNPKITKKPVHFDLPLDLTLEKCDQLAAAIRAYARGDKTALDLIGSDHDKEKPEGKEND